MECSLCKLQYIGKTKTPFNIRLNNHRKNATINNSKAISASIPFKKPGHNFNKYAKFTIIQQINNAINADMQWKCNKNKTEKIPGY